MNETPQPIVYPILFRFDDMTVPDDETFLGFWKLKALGGN